MPALSPTTFAVGASESLVAVDVHNQVGITVINGVKDLTTGDAPAGLEDLIPVKFDLSEIDKNIESANKAASNVSSETVTNSILTSNPVVANALKALPLDAKIVAAAGTDFQSKIKATLGNVESVITKSPLASVAGLSTIVSSLTGTKLPMSFKDVGALSKLATSTLKQASATGLAGVYTAFAGSATMIGSGVLANVTKAISPSLKELKNLPLLQEISNSPIGAAIIKSKLPNIVGTTLTNFGVDSLKASVGSKVVKSLGKSKALTTMLNNVQPGWTSTISGNKPVINAKSMIAASMPAVKSLQNSALVAARPLALQAAVSAISGGMTVFNTAANAGSNLYASIVSPPSKALMGPVAPAEAAMAAVSTPAPVAPAMPFMPPANVNLALAAQIPLSTALA